MELKKISLDTLGSLLFFHLLVLFPKEFLIANGSQKGCVIPVEVKEHVKAEFSIFLVNIVCRSHEDTKDLEKILPSFFSGVMIKLGLPPLCRYCRKEVVGKSGYPCQVRFELDIPLSTEEQMMMSADFRGEQ